MEASLWLVLATSACGAHDPSPPTPASPEPEAGEASGWRDAPVAAILRETARRSCRQSARCRSSLCMPVGAMAEVCHPARVEPRIDLALAAIRRGEAHFDRARALEVLRELFEHGSCRDQPRSPACDRGIDRTFEALVGRRGGGEACRHDHDCKSGRCRDHGAGRHVCAPRMASRPPRSEGVECERRSDCQPGRTCVTGRCRRPIPAGGRCDTALGRLAACAGDRVCTAEGCARGTDVGGACANDGSMTPCRHGALCRGNVCVEPGTPWGPCGTREHCPESFACRGDVCEPLPSLGQPCRSECLDGVCEGSVCAPVPVGAPCLGVVFGGKTCVDGARCDTRGGRCVRMPR